MSSEVLNERSSESFAGSAASTARGPHDAAAAAAAVVVVDDGTGTSPADVPMRRASPLAGVRRPSPLVTSGRQPSASPLRLSRPRSNPRTRTPMRYESPLNADAFRRDNIREEDDNHDGAIQHQPRVEGQRITIRPGAGQAVGSVMTTRTFQENRTTGSTRTAPARSRKQGLGQRKTRRYLNENFVNLAAELASSSSKGRTAAEILIKAQQDAPKYRSIYNPEEHQSAALTKFMNDSDMASVRDQFFKGELVEQPKLSRSHKIEPPCVTADDMMNRIDSRLRRIVVKACENSYPASKVVQTFEEYLVRAFMGKKIKTAADTWSDILLESPTITEKKNSDAILVKFLFHPTSSTGGFNRLLLHAVCEFHGLSARSSTMQIVIDDETQARVLTVTGNFIGEEVKLVDEVMRRADAHSSKRRVGASQTPAAQSDVDMITMKTQSIKV